MMYMTATIELQPVTSEDIQTLWKMQLEAFSELLQKYQDYETSPSAESMDKVMARYQQPWTHYYFIMADGQKAGAIRVVVKEGESKKRISPIWIMKEFRGRGYAQAAIHAVEKIFGSDNWSLDTILQEKGNCRLYEKLGYHRTGSIKNINERMDIVFYEKNSTEPGQ